MIKKNKQNTVINQPNHQPKKNKKRTLTPEMSKWIKIKNMAIIINIIKKSKYNRMQIKISMRNLKIWEKQLMKIINKDDG